MHCLCVERRNKDIGQFWKNSFMSLEQCFFAFVSRKQHFHFGFLRQNFQGCQMVFFKTKNQNLGKFWTVFKWKMWVNFNDIWPIYCYLEYLVAILYILWSFWYIFPVLVCCTKKNLAAQDFSSFATHKIFLTTRRPLEMTSPEQKLVHTYVYALTLFRVTRWVCVKKIAQNVRFRPNQCINFYIGEK
jgi:hypothetical protein